VTFSSLKQSQTQQTMNDTDYKTEIEWLLKSELIVCCWYEGFYSQNSLAYFLLKRDENQLLIELNN